MIYIPAICLFVQFCCHFVIHCPFFSNTIFEISRIEFKSIALRAVSIFLPLSLLFQWLGVAPNIILFDAKESSLPDWNITSEPENTNKNQIELCIPKNIDKILGKITELSNKWSKIVSIEVRNMPYNLRISINFINSTRPYHIVLKTFLVVVRITLIFHHCFDNNLNSVLLCLILRTLLFTLQWISV